MPDYAAAVMSWDRRWSDGPTFATESEAVEWAEFHARRWLEASVIERELGCMADGRPVFRSVEVSQTRRVARFSEGERA